MAAITICSDGDCTWVQSKKWQNDLNLFPNNPFNITVIKTDAPSTNAEEAQVDQFCEDLQDLLEQIQKKKKKKCLFHHGDWKAKVGSQEIPRVIGKFGLGVQNEADKG